MCIMPDIDYKTSRTFVDLTVEEESGAYHAQL